MIKENQPITTITKQELVERVAQLQKEGFRLVQIGCTSQENFEITYSFDKQYQLVNLRISVDRTEPVVPSISHLFFCAFTYENELQDLFGITVNDLKLNFKGTFYRLAVKTPFAAAPAAPAKPRPGAAQ